MLASEALRKAIEDFTREREIALKMPHHNPEFWRGVQCTIIGLRDRAEELEKHGL